MAMRWLAAALLILLAGCGPEESTPRTDNLPVRFGVILSKTGAASPYGVDNEKGLLLARDFINEQGGVRGAPIELLIEDSGGEASQGLALARSFAGDSTILGIVGPTRTGTTVAVSRILPTLQIPLMSVGSTGDWAGAAGAFNDWTFRSTRVDTYLIEPLLRTAADSLGVRRVAAIYTRDDDWSASVMGVYRDVTGRLGLDLVAVESQATGDLDRSAQLTAIRSAEPDAVIINTLSTDAPTIAAQARRLGITVPFLGTAGFSNPDTWDLADPADLEGTLVAENYYPGSDRPIVRRFVQLYRDRYGTEPPPYAAYAFDGLLLLAEAAERVEGRLTRETLRASLASLQEVETVLGTVTYDGPGDARKPAVILRIENGVYRLFAEGLPEG